MRASHGAFREGVLAAHHDQRHGRKELADEEDGRDGDDHAGQAALPRGPLPSSSSSRCSSSSAWRHRDGLGGQGFAGPEGSNGQRVEDDEEEEGQEELEGEVDPDDEPVVVELALAHGRAVEDDPGGVGPGVHPLAVGVGQVERDVEEQGPGQDGQHGPSGPRLVAHRRRQQRPGHGDVALHGDEHGHHAGARLGDVGHRVHDDVDRADEVPVLVRQEPRLTQRRQRLQQHLRQQQHAVNHLQADQQEGRRRLLAEVGQHHDGDAVA